MVYGRLVFACFVVSGLAASLWVPCCVFVMFRRFMMRAFRRPLWLNSNETIRPGDVLEDEMRTERERSL
jgi:hypothetical protein